MHDHFITVLEDAFRRPRPLITLSPRTFQGSQQDAATGTINLENRFANLPVGDIADLAEEEGMKEQELPVVTSIQVD